MSCFGFSATAGVVGAVLGVPVLAEAPPPPRPRPPSEVCGDPALVGTPLPAIAGEGGCGIAAPVSLAEAAGVALEPPATLACGMARALGGWLESDGKAAFAAGLEAILVVDSYSCRNRNRAEDAELSEHARGNAIDIAGFRLGDGTTVAVLDGWDSPEWGPTLRRLHQAGCGPFGTALGPEANPLHADHLHFDVEKRRSGPYCR
jgi:hypothetical protein